MFSRYVGKHRKGQPTRSATSNWAQAIGDSERQLAELRERRRESAAVQYGRGYLIGRYGSLLDGEMPW